MEKHLKTAKSVSEQMNVTMMADQKNARKKVDESHYMPGNSDEGRMMCYKIIAAPHKHWDTKWSAAQ